VYAGGGFTFVGGQPRSYAAALNASDGAATGWNPGFNGPIRSLRVEGPWIYTGGHFDTAAFIHQAGAVTALDTASAAPIGWDANGFQVNAVVVHGGRVYVTGNFEGIGGVTRYRLAALDAATGVVTPWSPSLTAGAGIPPLEGLALEARDGTVYVGGTFGGVGTYTVRGLAAIADPALVDVPRLGGPSRTSLELTASPSPMRDQARLHFTLPQATAVSLELFDPGGRRVQQVLTDVLLQAGPQDIVLERGKLRTGLYFLRLTAGEAAVAQKLVIVGE
jgi:hypothetical protein